MGVGVYPLRLRGVSAVVRPAHGSAGTMKIDPDVLQAAAHFGVPVKLIQGVVNAEGGIDRIVKAVQCSVPTVTTVEKALEVTCRSAAHAMSDYILHLDPAGFVEFWAARWAPPGAMNDPQMLNRNWPRNVRKGWLDL